ncbi:MAG: hypothetical protein VX294_11095 [Candidatus Latescibacterota bacterium]|nr:hypothetical protein [Candidatus Latescibacterota bacterium]
MDSTLEKRLLAIVFVFAMAMGSGPGLYLINPSENAIQSELLFVGLPRIYVWGLMWYIVQMSVIILAYTRYWKDEDDA